MAATGRPSAIAASTVVNPTPSARARSRLDNKRALGSGTGRDAATAARSSGARRTTIFSDKRSSIASSADVTPLSGGVFESPGIVVRLFTGTLHSDDVAVSGQEASLPERIAGTPSRITADALAAECLPDGGRVDECLYCESPSGSGVENG
jgi:hypothetical protein